MATEFWKVAIGQTGCPGREMSRPSGSADDGSA